jgi:hypothetical protein
MDVRGYIGENAASFFGALREWLAIPSMCTGMRGLIGAEIDLRGPDRDLHSGSFGGGVPNPLHALADLLAGLHDRDAPNEKVEMPLLLKGAEAAAYLWDELAAAGLTAAR